MASGHRLPCCASPNTPTLSYDNDISTKSSVQRYAPGCVRHRRKSKGKMMMRSFGDAEHDIIRIYLPPFRSQAHSPQFSLKQLRFSRYERSSPWEISDSSNC
ncbi:hypothetical protein K443DRAFT_292451 [Laccaria amethystina LaAM-08-1]|uniref:Uncharacterized protein n=1 Tax=Laccaria amethystina LaAM-08-1 TaxID=1095629 RepID=A0A0C9WKD6_9AGAR|nr:hypothetical protein K443DRAFT_292451 [Laccaria amethystina LaAM-08-1]